MLEGKAKEEFEKWFKSNDLYNSFSLEYNETDLLMDLVFYKQPLSMQWGVYQDFFNSVGVDIGCYKGETPHSIKKYVYLIEFKEDIYEGVQNTKQEAREAAIKKSVEIYNNR